VHARQEYHIALGRARTARQAEYVADTAIRALGAETTAAASELSAAREEGQPKRKWLRNQSAAPTPATASPAPVVPSARATPGTPVVPSTRATPAPPPAPAAGATAG
jgi:hypothetical protein